MELDHAFVVPVGVEEAWEAFADITSVAECFPGAVVTSVDGDRFQGTCKVKLGPVALQYAGSGAFVERDRDAHRMVVEATGRDKRGNGTAGATVTAVFTADGAQRTAVQVRSDLQITGKPAQFGRGLIKDVSDRLLGQFVTCLEAQVTAPPEPQDAGQPATPLSSTPPVSTEPASALPPPAAPAPAPADDALDLGGALAPVLVKAAWKPVAGLVLALLALRRLRRR